MGLISALQAGGLLRLRRHPAVPDVNPSPGCLQYVEDFPSGSELLAAGEALGLEGIVSKRRDAPYRSGARVDGSRSNAPPGSRPTGSGGGSSSEVADRHARCRPLQPVEICMVCGHVLDRTSDPFEGLPVECGDSRLDLLRRFALEGAMRNLYSMTRNRDAISRLFRVSHNRIPAIDPLTQILPGL